MIRGVGIDMVEVDRLRAAVARRGDALLERLFTSAELERCRVKRDPIEPLAARLAAKLSLMKALGRTIRFTSVEVASSGLGKPYFAFPDGPPEEGLRIALSMSHDGGIGVGQTIVEKVEGGRE